MHTKPSSPTDSQKRVLWFALTWLAVAVVITLIAGAIWGLARLLDVLSPVLWPLAIAAVVACLLSPLVDLFERRGLPRIRAIILVFVIAFAVVAGVLISIIPQVINETEELAKKIPDYSHRIQVRVQDFIDHPPELLQRFLPATPPDKDDTNPATPNTSTGPTPPSLTDATSWLTGRLPILGKWVLKQVGWVASGFGLIAGLILIPVYTFYFLLEKRGIESHWREYLPVRDSKAKDEIIFVLDAISQYLVAFFRGQVLVAMCDAVLYTIGFLSIGVRYAFLLGFAAVFLTIIPFIGAITLCIAALALAFVQYGDWLHPVLVLAVFAVVQTAEGLFISPKIMGNRVNLHPLVIIIAVMTGTTVLGGLLGGVLAIPLAAALRVIMFRYIWKKRKEVVA